MADTYKIMTHLWFDTEAAEAGEFYLKIFKNSRLISRNIIKDTPSGDAESLTLEIEDLRLMLISAGPYFKINPSISFMVLCDTMEETRGLWNSLIDGGMELMPLGEYDFSRLYAWVQDKYGVSWQLMFTEERGTGAKIRPAIMFTGENAGHAEEAMNYYAGVFKNSEIRRLSRYGEGFPPNKPEMVNFAEFILEGQTFSIMDSAYDHKFQLNEAVSLIVECDDQEEIDYYFDTLSKVEEAEQCGWLKDKYGVSWQIAPRIMNDLMNDPDEKAVARVTRAFLKMKKFNLEEIIKAYKGEEEK